MHIFWSSDLFNVSSRICGYNSFESVPPVDCRVKEFRMTTPKPTNTIAACFQAAKRVRLDADLDAAHISNFDTTAEPGDNEAPGLVSISKKAKTETTTQDSPDGSNAGVETDRTEDGTSISGSKGEDVVSPGEGTESNLTKEQRMRMELNKGIARAKRNLKACEDHVEKCRGKARYTTYLSIHCL